MEAQEAPPPSSLPPPKETATPTPPPNLSPAPAPELAKLTFLVGEWVHAEVFHASPLSGEGKGAARSKMSWVLGDQYLYVLYASRRPEGLSEARGYLGWDAEAHAYGLDWFDESGIRKRYRGQFTGPALVLTAEYPLLGKTARERRTWRAREDGKLLITSEVTLGDQPPVPVMEALLTPVSSGH